MFSISLALFAAIHKSHFHQLAMTNLLTELPYFPEISPITVTQFDINELFRDGIPTSKIASDGILAFHSVTFATSNAKEMARYLESVMGFREIAFRSLESDSPLVGAHVVQNGNVTFVIVNNLEIPDGERCNVDIHQKLALAFGKSPNGVEDACLAGQFASVREKFSRIDRLDALTSVQNTQLCQLAADAINAWKIHRFVNRHGMGVSNISFEVDDVDETFQKSVSNGATSLQLPAIHQDEFGSVKMALVSSPNHDCTYTLIQNLDYSGTYLPHFKASLSKFDNNVVMFHEIDHCVQNFSWNEMLPNASFYAAAFGLHKFWSVDDNDVSTGNTALRSMVMANSNGKVRIPINEPVKSKFRGQIEEFHDYFGGPGVQHVALSTRDILHSVASLQTRGLKFNRISEEYYVNLKERLDRDQIDLYEDFERIRELQILVDFDPATKYLTPCGKYRCHYLLQIFSEPFHDRPTFFIEIIQRHHHNGFGKGTFKGLFESIELQQRKRGTLVPIE